MEFSFQHPLDLDLSMLDGVPPMPTRLAIPRGGGPKMTVENAAKVALG